MFVFSFYQNNISTSLALSHVRIFLFFRAKSESWMINLSYAKTLIFFFRTTDKHKRNHFIIDYLCTSRYNLAASKFWIICILNQIRKAFIAFQDTSQWTPYVYIFRIIFRIIVLSAQRYMWTLLEDSARILGIGTSEYQ